MKKEIERLLKLTREECKKRFPGGFNKQQMIDVSEEIKKRERISDPVNFGKIKTDRDVDLQRSNMINDGGYPASISDCEVIGINGDCSVHCPVFKDGICDNVSEDEKEWKDRIEAEYGRGKEADTWLDLYGLLE